MDKLNTSFFGFNKSTFGSEIWTDALAPSKSSNEGGTAGVEISAMQQTSEDPRLVTRGERLWHEVTNEEGQRFIADFSNPYRPKLIEISTPKVNGVANAAIVDYLNCSFNFEKVSIQDFFAELLPILGHSFSPVVDRGRGIYGYAHSFQFGETAGIFAYGGNKGTGFLSLSGECCHRIADWPQLVNFLESDLDSYITRWDGAYDDFEGIHSVDNSLTMYQENIFNSGGRKPRMRQVGNWIEPDGTGRTIYIGVAKNGKMARIYEKGMQLGVPYHPWVRWEVQLGNRDRLIPWQAVLEPGKYLAGSYVNALGWISEEQSRIRTLQKTSEIGYESLTHWLSIAYGKHINAMMIKERSADKVIEMLRREGLPSRLVLPDIPNYGKVLP